MSVEKVTADLRWVLALTDQALGLLAAARQGQDITSALDTLSERVAALPTDPDAYRVATGSLQPDPAATKVVVWALRGGVAALLRGDLDRAGGLLGEDAPRPRPGPTWYGQLEDAIARGRHGLEPDLTDLKQALDEAEAANAHFTASPSATPAAHNWLAHDRHVTARYRRCAELVEAGRWDQALRTLDEAKVLAAATPAL